MSDVADDKPGAHGPADAAPRGIELLARLGASAGRVESASVLIATLILVGIIGAFHSDFLAISQLKDVVQQSVYVALLAAGMSFLIAMREIDLSVGSAFGLTLVAAALLMQHGWSPWPAALTGIGIGGAFGLFNAILVQAIRIPAIVATLGTLSMGRGLALALTNGEQVTNLPAQSSFFTVLGGSRLGLPVSVWVLIAVTILLTLLLRMTPFGYRVRAIGSNPDAAAFSGIPIARVRMQALVLMGLLAGLAGMLGLSFFISGDPNIGTGFELQAIAAAIIGGTALQGGSATVFGAVIGAILLGVVNSGLVFFDVPVNWSAFATGAVILLAVAIDSVLRRRRLTRSPGLGL